MTMATPGIVVPQEVEARRALLCFATSAAVESYGAGSWRTLDFGSADLSILRTGRAPLLADHERHLGAVLGVVESAWLEEEQAFAVVRFAGSPRALEAWSFVQDRIVTNVSMGFTFKPGAEVADEGEDLRVIRNWRPYEVSLVAVPANWSASVLPNAPPLVLDALSEATEERRRRELRTVMERGRREQRQAWATELAPKVAQSLGTDPQRTAAALIEATSLS